MEYDHELAWEFAHLLESATSGILRTFVAGAKQPGQGLAFGQDWWTEIKQKVQASSALVCLLTPRSHRRPWILFEAGLAVSNPTRRVFGVSFGLSVEELYNTPLAQIYNSADSEGDLINVIKQLGECHPSLKPSHDALQYHVRAFMKKSQDFLQGTVGAESVATPERRLNTVDMFEEVKRIPKDITAQMVKLMQEGVLGNLARFADTCNTLQIGYEKLTTDFEDLVTGIGVGPVSFPMGHETAHDDMLGCIEKAATSGQGRPVSVRVLGVSLRFSWPFLEKALPQLLRNYPDSTFVIELAMVDPQFLRDRGIKDWAEAAAQVYQKYRQFQNAPERTDARLEVNLWRYTNLPQWHGMLIDNADLFLGRSDWRFGEADPTSYQFTVGQNKYRWFSKKDKFGGAERIQLFNNWFDYFKLDAGRTGRADS
jgi:hypothetical protein